MIWLLGGFTLCVAVTLAILWYAAPEIPG